MKVAIRGYAAGKQIFEELYDGENLNLEMLAKHHAELLRDRPKHMIEVEFLDHPDDPYRFFRFGTDPEGMVMPLELEL